MQVNNDYIDELFARKLGNMETTPPEDGWIRIENELNHRSRMTRRFWLAAASFALLLSATATVVYMQTHIAADTGTAIAIAENTSLQPEEPSSNIAQGDAIAPIEKDQPVVQQRGNSATVERETFASATAAPSPVSVAATALQDEDDAVLQETTDAALMQGNVAVADIREDAKSHPNTSVYIDPWDEMLRVQPIKANRLEFLSDKIARFKLENPEKKAEEKVAVAASRLPAYDAFAFMDIADGPAKSRNRWEITGQFAPVYQSYRAISSVPGGLRKSDFDDAESSLMAYSGGISLAYRLYNRLSVQTGIFYSQTGQSINNVVRVPNMYAAVSSNNSYSKNFVKTSSGSVTVASNLKSDANSSYASYFNAESQTANAVSVANVANPAKSKLIERIDYLEIPLLLRYKIFDRKMNFYVLGGMSANVLIDTNVFVDNGSEIVKGGNILMARPVNYSSTFGLGFGYQMMKNLSFGLEPSFKYYLQSYTTSSQISTNPYAFGLFTSVFYQF